MAEYFIWQPVEDIQADVKFEADFAPFGDGYEQVSEEGINPKRDSFSLQFHGHKIDNDMGALKLFLDRHRGARPFLWYAPSDTVARLWMIAEQSYKVIFHNDGFMTIDVTFRERITP